MTLWPAGAATGIGSLPGTDPREAARLVFGELPELPHLPELPARGPGADMIGRSAVLLVDLPVEVRAAGWTFTTRPGRDLTRARDFLAFDLDAVEEVGAEFDGTFKVQLAGPLTLAASIELPTGHRAVSDPGAVREIAASLAEGLRLHIADVGRRLPHARIVVQVDEPSLPAVIGARIPTPSGYGTVRAVSAEIVEQRLRTVLDVAADGARVVHCCAADIPIALLRSAGADAVSLDMAILSNAHLDALGEAVDAGTSLWLGAIASTGDADELATGPAVERIVSMWNRLGFPREQLAASVVATPACGLAAAHPDYARRALTVLREAGHELVQG